MGKYLKKFENHSAYEAAESGLILPNVSLCVQEHDVHYNPYVPPIIDGHEYVDLGLPNGTMWATMNVGASSITDYGNYYQYGKGSGQYAATSGQSNYSGTENPLAATADTATVEWGGSWHMPTSAQCAELTANTTYEWTTINGVNGGKFTAANGNYVFFPASGFYQNGIVYDIGISGFYWGSTTDHSTYAKCLVLGDGNGNRGLGYPRRSNGYPVRPVVG